jgi:hypothetical protein
VPLGFRIRILEWLPFRQHALMQDARNEDAVAIGAVKQHMPPLLKAT